MSASTSNDNFLGMNLDDISDASGVKVNDASGIDISGVSPTGLLGFYKRLWDKFGFKSNPLDSLRWKVGGVLFMFIMAFMAGLGVLFFFICSQNLMYLTESRNIAPIPTTLSSPPYNPGVASGGGGTMKSMFTEYGAPYSWKDNPTIFPFIPCNFSGLRTLFGIKEWFGKTSMYSWYYGRKLLKVVLKGIGAFPDILKMLFAFPIISFMLAPVHVVTTVFTIVGSFESSILWSILGIIFWFLGGLIVILGALQGLALAWHLLFSPFASREGRAYITEGVHKHKGMLSIVYVLVLILMSPVFLSPWWTLGMILGVLFLGFN